MHICLLLLPSVCKVFHKTKVPQFNLWELWCWRRLLRVPLIARRSNQSILRKINPEYSWKAWCWTWNSCILVIWCEQLTHWKSPWCWERLRAEEEKDVRGWDGWMASLMQWTWTWANFGRWWGTREAWHSAVQDSHRVGHEWGAEQQPTPCPVLFLEDSCTDKVHAIGHLIHTALCTCIRFL